MVKCCLIPIKATAMTRTLVECYLMPIKGAAMNCSTFFLRGKTTINQINVGLRDEVINVLAKGG